jgi:hypothetical protein
LLTDILTVDDLALFAEIDEEKAEAMISGAVAMAAIVAPCLDDPDALTPKQLAAAQMIIRDAVLRWADSGSGAATTQTAGPFGVTYDTRTPRKTLFWPSEITALQRVCRSGTGGMFNVGTAPVEPMVSRQVYGEYVDGVERFCWDWP